MNKVISTIIAALLAFVAIPQVAQAQETAIHDPVRITATRLTVYGNCQRPTSTSAYCKLVAPRVVQGVRTLHRITHVTHVNGTVIFALTTRGRHVRLYGVRVAATLWEDGSGLTFNNRPFCLAVGICTGYGTDNRTITGGFLVRDYLYEMRDGHWNGWTHLLSA